MLGVEQGQAGSSAPGHPRPAASSSPGLCPSKRASVLLGCGGGLNSFRVFYSHKEKASKSRSPPPSLLVKGILGKLGKKNPAPTDAFI